MPYDDVHGFTDRDERALLAAAENRISEPLRIGAALASVRRLFARHSPVRAKARESLPCQQPNTRPRPLPR
ncbi:hypothetical protein BX286_5731 [Streptomyces sp. 3211.6]|nr:hypothetical protein BX286_5731 [Streptomyces sp. 3211.6]RPF44708.1 hypothetical protein EDD96_1246 [Streptomyces sp. Ag109_G2-6]